MKISATLINKNEEDFLGITLRSIRPYVDEIAMVDTGSTDNSLEIAKPYVDKLLKTEWKYDFGYHRNQAMDLASNDWVLVVAGDTPWVQLRDKCLHMLVNDAIASEAEIVVFPHLEFWYEMPVVAFTMIQKGNNGPLFNRNRYRWYGKIHEMISTETPIYNTDYVDTRGVKPKEIKMPTKVVLGGIIKSLDFCKFHFRYFKQDEAFALRNIDYNMIYFNEPVREMTPDYIHSIKNTYKNNQTDYDKYKSLPLYDEHVFEKCMDDGSQFGPFIYTGALPRGLELLEWIPWTQIPPVVV